MQKMVNDVHNTSVEMYIEDRKTEAMNFNGVDLINV
jgi:hypothetical protein